MNIAQEYLEAKATGAAAVTLDPLRTLIEDALEAAARPGRYVDRMAYILDQCYALQGVQPSQEASLQGWGEHCARYGKRLLHTNSQGFVESATYKSERLAMFAFNQFTRGWEIDDSQDWA